MHQTSMGLSATVAKIMAEKRSNNRVDAVFSGSLHVEDKFAGHCVIKDVSLTGMRLKIGAELFLPEEFQIKTPAMSGMITVKKAWKQGREIGVSFVETPAGEAAE